MWDLDGVEVILEPTWRHYALAEITSRRNEYTANDISVAFWLVCCLEKEEFYRV